MADSIGMMEGAFFVPKTSILSWINSLLKLNITKIQQLGTGAVYCQLLDIMFPGKINMQKVNWKARNQWQFITNLKLLQQSFIKCKVNKHIEIQKLSKSKYQDNLQFIQWMKRYFDLHNKNDVNLYDPVSARKGSNIDFSFVQLRNFKKKNQSFASKEKIKPSYNLPKIHKRSLTTSKCQKNTNNYYLSKLYQIKLILNKKEQQQKIAKIQQIIQEVQSSIPQVIIPERYQTIANDERPLNNNNTNRIKLKTIK